MKNGAEVLFEYKMHDERWRECTYQYMADRARTCSEVIR